MRLQRLTARTLMALAALTVVVGCTPDDGVRSSDGDLAALPEIESAASTREALAIATDSDADPTRRASAYRTVGRAWFSRGLWDAASVALGNATRLAPKDAAASYLLALAEGERGNAEAAEAGLRRVLELEPDYTAARIRLGRLLADRGATEAARAELETAAREDAFAAAAHAALGQLAVSEGQPQAAVDHFERALELQPESGRLRYRLGQAWLRLGDEARARPYLEAAGEGEVAFPDPWVADTGGAMGPAERLNAAGRAFFEGRFAEAADGYRSVLDAQPDNLEARRGLALTLARSGDRDGARAAFLEALRLAPDDAELERGLGLLLLREGDAGGLARLQRAVGLDPQSVDSRVALGDALRLSGRLEPAMAQYDAALEVDPTRRDARHGRAAVLLAQGRADEALAMLRAAVDEDPDDHVARANLGAMLVAAGRHDEAEPILTALLEANPPRPLAARASYNLGIVAAARRDDAAAQRHFSAAVEADPLLSDARLYFAAGLARDGRYEEAAGHLARVVEDDPDNLRARLAEATALVLSGRPSQARQRLERGLARQPDQPLLTLALARLLATSADDGVRDGARALELSQRLYDAQASLEHIEALAAAHAERGDFDRAIALQESLVAHAAEMGDTGLADHFGRDLERYRRGRPSRIPPETPP